MKEREREKMDRNVRGMIRFVWSESEQEQVVE